MSVERNPQTMLLRVAFWSLLAAAAFTWMLHGGARRVREHAPATQQTVPREMVGAWTSTRGAVARCIELRDDGGYRMVPNTEAGDRFGVESGTWRVVDQDIVWRSDSQPNATDRNRMIGVADGHFNTLEADSTQTRFERIVAGPAARCPH